MSIYATPLQKRQEGAVLVLSLIFMLLTAIIVSTLLSTSSVELKMAVNEQLRLEAAQKSEAIVDSIFDAIDDSEEDGYLKNEKERLCILGDVNVNCIAAGLLPAINAALTSVATDEYLEYYIQYQSDNVPGYTVLDQEEVGSGEYGLYEIHVEYDASELGRGKSNVVQGILMSYGEGSDQERREEDADIYRDINVEL